jgi:nucleoside-diphosphate-sugar epimerase
MSTALIGYTGFVGGGLLRSGDWTDCYNSSNIGQISGKKYRRIVCAGIQAKKWWANQNPVEDWQGIESLLHSLDGADADEFVMISTVDVYMTPAAVDEDTPVDLANLHPYGLHRWRAEEHVRKKFPRCFILRLPGLFGPGLRKNLIFDMMHGRDLPQLDASTVYQYYNTERLAQDIETTVKAELPLVNISTEPVSTERLIREVFPAYPVVDRGTRVSYDMRSKHAELFGGRGHYMQDANTVLQEIRDFVAREPRTGII